MYRYDIINALIDKFNYQSYLEIGIDLCQNYFKVNCKYKECVDPYQEKGENEFKDTFNAKEESVKSFIRKNVLTYQMTSDDFFAILPPGKKYDIIFIDGLHKEEQVGRDIINSLKHLNPNGCVVCHDCLPRYYEHQVEDIDKNYHGPWNGSVWKAIPMLKRQGIDYMTVDTDCGCGIIRYNGNPSKLSYPQKSELNFNEVFLNKKIRDIVMNVVTIDEFNKILKDS